MVTEQGNAPWGHINPQKCPHGTWPGYPALTAAVVFGVDLGINLNARCLFAVSPMLSSLALLLPVPYFSSSFAKEHLLL